MVVAKEEEEEVIGDSSNEKRSLPSQSTHGGMANLKLNGYNCHKIGHFSWECHSAPNNDEEKVNPVNEDEESTLLLTLKEEEKDANSSWNLDDGARNHMHVWIQGDIFGA